MNGELLVVGKQGAMWPSDRTKLEALGLVVIEVDDPAHVRLLRPSSQVDGDALLRCAIQALASGSFASEQRENFAKLLAASMKETKP